MERFLDYFIPSHYQLEECIFRQDKTFKGKVRITGKITDHSVVKFHAVNLDVTEITWQPYWRGYETASDTYASVKCEFTYDDQAITIPITDDMRETIVQCRQDSDDTQSDPALAEQDVVFEIIFSAKLNENMQGCYLSTYQFQDAEQRIVATQFESHYAREAFPCIDEPAAKAIFDLTLIVPDYGERDVVLANTPAIGQTNGRFEFASTPRMSTYLLAWVVGPFQSVSTVNENGIKVSSYAALNQSLESLIFANRTAVRALEYYDAQFGTPYPLAKLDQVALPDFEAGAMENWGLVTYRESCMLADPSASLETKKSVAITVTHELSHQWFGDLVTMAWWDDLWLNESFATVMEYCATDALYPEFKIWQDFFTGDCLAALRRDCLRGVQSVQQAVRDPAEIPTLFDGAIVYAKGARLVLMLMRLLTPEKFYRGITQYFDQHQYQNTVGDDLWAALQPFADFDVKDFMHAWISQPGYPALQRAKNGDQDFWHQQRFFIDGTTDDTEWPLPEVVDDMSGHYLLDLSDDAFQAKLADFAQLSTEQKLRLLIDHMLLAKANLVPSVSLLQLLPKFAEETSAAVWHILINIIGELKLFCPPDSAAEQNYHQYLADTYRQALSSINLSADQNTNDLQVRGNLISIANYIEDESVLRPLAELYTSDLTLLDSELRIYIMVAQMHFDENATFAALLKAYPQTSDPEIKSDILYCLTTAKHSQNFSQLIDLLDRPNLVRPQDHIFLYIYLLRNYRTREQALDWLVTHWDYLKTLTGEKSIEDYPRYAAAVIRTPEEAQKFYAFFDPLSSDPALQRTIKVAHTEIDARLALIKSQSARVATELQNLTNS